MLPSIIPLLLRRERGFRAEPLVAAVGNSQSDALRPCAELKRIVGVGINRKPVLTIYWLADGSEARKQVLGLRRPDLWNRLAFHAHDVVLLLVHPNQAVEEPLPL